MVFPFAESARGLELMRVQYARSVPLMRQRVSTQNGRANCRPPNSGGFGNFLAFRVPASELVYSKRFADHHRFTQQEILNTINRAKKREAQIIVTTQKDAVRFPKIDRRDLPIFFMRVEIKIVAGANDFQDCVGKICFR